MWRFSCIQEVSAIKGFDSNVCGVLVSWKAFSYDKWSHIEVWLHMQQYLILKNVIF